MTAPVPEQGDSAPAARDDEVEREIEGLVTIAELQRGVLGCILAHLLVTIAVRLAGTVPALVVLAAALCLKAIATYFLVRVAFVLYGHTRAMVAGLLFVAPNAVELLAGPAAERAVVGAAAVAGIATLVLVVRGATKRLKGAGATVGLLGATPSTVRVSARAHSLRRRQMAPPPS